MLNRRLERAGPADRNGFARRSGSVKLLVVSSGEQAPETSLPVPIPVQDPRLIEFVAAFREAKHYLVNSVAIWTAQAELGVRNPDFHAKLAQSILERSAKLLELTRDTESKLKTFAPYGPEGTEPKSQ